MTGRVTGVLQANGFSIPLNLKTQVLALDQQFIDMELEITRLNAKVQNLESKVNPLQREIDGLKKKLEIKGGLLLNEEETNIMKYLARVEHAKFIGEIAKNLKLNEIRARVLLLSLIDRGLVAKVPHIYGGIMFGLTNDGASTPWNMDTLDE